MDILTVIGMVVVFFILLKIRAVFSAGPSINIQVKQIPNEAPKPRKRKPAPEADAPKCPHCKFQFEKMPRAKRKCPACKELVFPRCSPTGKVKRLVTEDQADKWAADANKKELAAWFKQQVREYRSEIKDGIIPDAFDFIATLDSCEICKQFERQSPYRLNELPEPGKDTHPFCLCCVTPHG